MTNILPSILTSDFTDVNKDIEVFKKMNIDEIHLDVMDGNFVNALTFGPKYISDIRKNNSDIKLDAHLMISNPLKSINDYIEAKPNVISIHIEACKIKDIISMKEEVSKNNIKFGLAINPETNIKLLLKVLKKVSPDVIIIMSVHPGAGGQEFIPEVLEKAKVLNSLKETNNFKYELEIDGGININNIKEVIDNHIDRIVIGSAIYKGGLLEENIKEFQNKITLIAGNN